MPLTDQPTQPTLEPDRHGTVPIEVAPSAGILLPQHAALLETSGISSTVAQARGYRSATSLLELQELGFGRQQITLLPALIIPIYSVHGRHLFSQIRPDQPRFHSGLLARYEVPYRTQVGLDVHPQVQSVLRDVSVPLYVVAGIKAADAGTSHGLNCITLLGYDRWRRKTSQGRRDPLPDWDAIALQGRFIYIIIDSVAALDQDTNTSIQRLGAFLHGRNAHTQIIRLPATATSKKVGLDDFLSGGRTVGELLALARTEPSNDLPVDRLAIRQYRAEPEGLFLVIPGEDGEVLRQLTNFQARIIGQRMSTDGIDVQRRFEIEAIIGDKTTRFTIPAEDFEPMKWVFQYIGAEAIIAAGPWLKEHARSAIQYVSGTIPSQTAYRHTGWIKLRGEWRFLHAGGSIGPESDDGSAGAVCTNHGVDKGPETASPTSVAPSTDSQASQAVTPNGPIGPIPAQQECYNGLTVELPQALARFFLPRPTDRLHLINDIRTCFEVIDIVPDRIALPTFAAVWRATLGDTDFSMHGFGKTGIGKSEFFALHQQFFGAAMKRQHLPAAWASTGNALEAICFQAKDVIIVIDDFVPEGSFSDISRSYRDASRLFRAQGNRSGRARCDRDGTPKEGKPPRGLIFSTGEDVPRGHSVNARVLNLRFEEGELKWERLSICQEHAFRGVYAQVMANFLAWVAGRYEKLRTETHMQAEQFRDLFRTECEHPRTATIAGELLAGFEVFLDFAVEKEAITQAEFDNWWERIHDALRVTLTEQNYGQQEEDPVNLFLSLLRGALLGGYANVAGVDGGPPPFWVGASHKAWGWEQRNFLVPKKTPTQFAHNDPAKDPDDEDGEEYDRLLQDVEKCWPKGKRIGWLWHGELFLEPTATLAVTHRLAGDCGRSLPFTERTLGRALHAKGLLLARDERRGRYTVRKNVEGHRTYVFAINPGVVLSREWNSAPCLEPGYEGPFPDDLLA